MAVVGNLFLLFGACSEATAQKPPVGGIIGNIDGISHVGEQYFISGWALDAIFFGKWRN